MYAVIKTGGKQARVELGQRLDVELVPAPLDDQLVLSPVLIVDGDTVLAGPGQLSSARVTAKVVGQAKGPKIRGFKYKPKTNQRRRWGHRQRYSTIEITGITTAAAAGRPAAGQSEE